MFVVFIPLAEQTGLIAKMGEWAIRRACVDAASWPESVSVAVNVSPLSIVEAVCGPAKRLGMRLVVEGIETEDQRGAIQSMGADKAQGYLFGRPESVETLLPRLRKAS